MGNNTARRLLALLIATAAALLLALPASANHMTGGGKSFLFLQPGFTQDLAGTHSGFFGGVAFDPNGNPWVDFCTFSGSPLLRFDLSTPDPATPTGEGHVGTLVPSNAGCGLTNNSDGFVYSNTDRGAVQINATTGAATGTIRGPAGNALGITTDPQNGHLVYVGADCRFTGTCTIYSVDPSNGTTTTFASLRGHDFIDGIAFSPDGNYLFMSHRAPGLDLEILNRSGAIVQLVPMSSEPDGISFHASAPKFVVTDNTDGTMTRFDFPGDNFTMIPVQSVFASGGFRGDLSQVGPDGCIYLSQDGTRFKNGVTSGNSSLARICGGFAPPIPPKKADLSVTKTGPAFVQSGGTITYVITVKNAGPANATNVTVNDPLPAGETLVSATPSQGTCGDTVTCNLGSIASGGSATVTIVATVTAASGSTICNTAKVSGDQPDPDTDNNSSTTCAFVYAVSAGGNFVIGDLNAAVGTNVTFWGAQWWKLNSLSGGAAPAAFKGFEDTPAAPGCGTNWTTDPGNSTPPPAGPLPAYMAVLVSSSISKSGSTISGNTPHIVIVKTNAGYDANPGHAGTGTVFAQVC
jgi:uncharacterized repeat protein (TIGR01451 family)